MNNLNTFLLLYKRQPEFVNDLIHVQYLKTRYLNYYDYALINVFSSIQFNTPLDVNLSMLPRAISYIIEDGKYLIKTETNELGFPALTPFFELFEMLLLNVSNPEHPTELIDKLYSSKHPLLIQLAENIKGSPDQVEELLMLLKSKEFDSSIEWTLGKLINSNYNYKYLAINESILPKILISPTIRFVLRPLRHAVAGIETKEFSPRAYKEYILRVNVLIKGLFLNIERTKTIQRNEYEWQCSICGGSSVTGCLFFDPSECPRVS